MNEVNVNEEKINNELEEVGVNEETESEILQPHKDLPELKEFCITFCDYELRKADEITRSTKKRRKGTIELQNKIKFGSELDFMDILKNFTEFNAAYEELNKELYKVDEEVKEMNARQAKALAMEEAVVENKERLESEYKEIHGEEVNLTEDVNNKLKGVQNETNED